MQIGWVAYAIRVGWLMSILVLIIYSAALLPNLLTSYCYMVILTLICVNVT